MPSALASTPASGNTNCLCLRTGEGSVPKKALNSKGLAARGGPRETAEIPRHHRSYVTPSDMGLMSMPSKQVLLLELTVPREDSRRETDLVAECWRNGWKAHCEPVEMGYRGITGQSLHWVLGSLGICGQHRRRATKNNL